MAVLRVRELRFYALVDSALPEVLVATHEKIERRDGDDLVSFWQIQQTPRPTPTSVDRYRPVVRAYSRRPAY